MSILLITPEEYSAQREATMASLVGRIDLQEALNEYDAAIAAKGE